MPPLLPLFLYMSGRRALVIGGGRAAALKIRALLRAGAYVTVIAPRVCPMVKTLLRTSSEVEHRVRKASPRDVRTAYTLVFPLSDDEGLNTKLAKVARRKRIWVGGSSHPDRADFSLAATFDQGPVRLAISTEGGSPTLARLLAKRLGEFLATTLLPSIVATADTRLILRQTVPDPHKRRRILAKVARGFMNTQ